MTWAFLGLISDVLGVSGVPAHESGKGGAWMAEEVVGIFLRRSPGQERGVRQ